MASLTDTAFYTRRTINWIIIGLIAYFILRVLFSLFVGVFLTVFPPKPPPPTHAFGKIPALKFPEVASPSGQLTFQLETIQGTLPKASESAAVYFMPKKPANLLALTVTQDFASRLGLDSNPIQESKNIYRFNDPELPLRKLRYDIVSDNFIVRYGFEQDIGLFADRNLPFEDAAKSESLSMLQTYNLYSKDIAGGRIEVTFLKLVGNRLVQTTSQSQADALRVDFFRKSIGNTQVVTPFPDEGPISFVFSGSKTDKKRLLQFAYTYWPVDYPTNASYGLKTSNQAWQELQSDGGFIARYPRGDTAVVRNIYIAYYDSYDPQMYLQPVFVFEGDDGFLAYVPAVAPPWTE